VPVLTITPEQEERVVRIAAARAGCRIVELGPQDGPYGVHAMGHVECPTGWEAARMVVAEALEYAKTPGLRGLALQLRQQAPSDAAYARAVHQFVKDHVAFVREEGEIFQGPAVTLAAGAGDCDDQAILVLALAYAGGLPAVGAFLHEGGDPTHAVAQLCPSGQCSWAETTVDANYGEHPLAAARRAGVLTDRSDLTQGVVLMSEKDLAPIPADYRAGNPPDETAATSADLVSLGYLASGAETSDPTDHVFRVAVLALQLAHPPLAADGLTGPATRATIAGLMGAVTTSRTAYLSDAFLSDLVAWATTLQAKGAKANGLDFLAVWQGESGISPSAGNTLGFGGLNGMGPAERKAVGFSGTQAEWQALDVLSQLQYVKRYYEINVAAFAGGDFSVLTDAGALYLLNYHPAHIRHAGDPSFVLTRRSPGDDGSAAWRAAHPGDDYANNAGLDFGHKGWIEVADMSRWVFAVTHAAGTNAKFVELAERMNALGDPAAIPELSALTTGFVLVAATAIGGALAELLERFT
jgi:Transglutaminase-like superfamily